MHRVWKKALPLMVSPHLSAWLNYSGSFIERLRSINVQNIAIHILEEAMATPEAWEMDCLKKDLNTALIREVLIQNNDQCLMYARTVIPPETLSGELAVLADLKTRSLGSVLFNHPLMQRSAFDFTLLKEDDPWHHLVSTHLKRVLPALWARRSIFSIDEKKLLVTEVFLPAIEAV